MQVTIDVSMYPNRKEFIPPVDRFIERINQFDQVKITTLPTSTVVQGQYEHAMQALQKTIADCYKEYDMAVYVMKVIPGYEALK